MTQTLTRSYDSYSSAKSAVAELQAAGFSETDIAVLAHSDGADDTTLDGATKGAGVGVAAGGAVGLLTGLGLMAIPGVGPVVAAGWFAATTIGALAGGAVGAVSGGVIDSLVNSGVDHHDAPVYAETLRRGGSVVSIRTPDHRRDEAAEILDRAGPTNIETRRQAYESEGWKAYDPDAAPLTAAEIEAERRRHT